MADLTQVGITNGIPDTGTGTVATINALMALVGEVQASPTSLTLLDRLKTLATTLTAIDGHVDGLEGKDYATQTTLAAIATAIGTAVLTRGAGASDANTLRVVLASEQVDGSEYETVATSTTATLGTTGATGDFLAGVLIIPGTTSPGKVQIKDGSNTAVDIFTGGASSVSNLVPFYVPIGANSTAGAWQVITLTNATAVGFGNFT